MNPHETLLNDPNIYPENIINNFGAVDKKWGLMNPQEREKLMRNTMVCLYTCNLETESITCMLKRISVKRKAKINPVTPQGKKIKVEIVEDDPDNRQFHDPNMPSTSQLQPGETPYEEGKEEEEELDSESYRFHYLNSNLIYGKIVKKYCDEWGFKEMTGKWDIVDTVQKKFIRVGVDVGFDRWIKKLKNSTGYVEEYCKYIFYDINFLSVKHDYQTDPPVGIEKARTFLIQRNQEFLRQGVLETTMRESVDLISTIFGSMTINQGINEWIEDIEDEVDIERNFHELYSEFTRLPMPIYAKELYSKLTKLEKDDERKDPVMWRGKIVPDGWVANITTRFPHDKDNVDIFVKKMGKEMRNVQHVYSNTSSESILDEKVFDLILKIWSEGDRNTFDFLRNANAEEKRRISALLGDNMKKKTNSPLLPDMKQPEYEPIEKMCYSPWIDEVLRRLSNNHVLEGIPYIHLTEKASDDGHPMAKICEEVTSNLVSTLLTTNAALFSSRITNLYSRLGGAYFKRKITRNKDRNRAAIFPILAVTNIIGVHEEEKDSLRHISGVVLRGQQHAKNPTDKISILTIERLIRDSETYELIQHIKNCIAVITSKSIYLLRQNSVMKEDTSYLTFNINSLFSPINLLGVMTLEDPTVPSDCNMKEHILNLLKESSKWFKDRFTEGVVMSAIGNSRDEGYFACLRKIYLILMSYREGNHSACWDISSFCSKTNDCLIDNPLSMHFHISILNVLKRYVEEQVNYSMM